jgi:hypothetical protein
LELEKIVGQQQITSLNILTFTLALMQVVENYPHLRGREKKDLVLRVIRTFVSNKMTNGEELLVLLPSFIDTSIDLDRGHVTVQFRSEDALLCCFGLCANLLNSAKTKK